MWESLTPVLNSWGYKVYVFDLPCHGLSRFSGTKCSMEEMAILLNGFCKKYSLEDVKIIGHSMGGYVGLELLKLAKHSLILLHSNFWEDSAAKKEDRNRLIRLIGKSKELFINEAIPHLFYEPNKEKCKKSIEHIIEIAVQIPAEEIAASSAGLRDRCFAHELFESADITIIHGQDDPVCTTEVLDSELEKLATNPTVLRIENCGHMSIWEQPEELIQRLKTILV